MSDERFDIEVKLDEEQRRFFLRVAREHYDYATNEQGFDHEDALVAVYLAGGAHGGSAGAYMQQAMQGTGALPSPDVPGLGPAAPRAEKESGGDS